MHFYISSALVLCLLFLMSCGSTSFTEVKVESKSPNSRFTKNEK